MVVLGGAVRLTGSGLSMVDWRPLMGIFPPIGVQAWNAVFDQYKQYPEYQLVNQGMTLSQFKFIYYMEYCHRMLGRMIGVFFFIPFLVFMLRGLIPDWLKVPLWIAFLLGACQGLMGWYMVQSGLVDNPHVSQYRLTAHLLLAVVIYAWLVRLFFALVFSSPGLRESSQWARRWGVTAGRGVIGLILLMIATGGFMAGTRAGFTYNTWPTMAGLWVPEQLWALQPGWRNIFENVTTVNFIHRWLALIVLLSVTSYSLGCINRDRADIVRKLGFLVLGLVVLQVLLGIFTLILRVPVALGVLHQGVALLVLAATVGVFSAFSPKPVDLPGEGMDRLQRSGEF